MEFLLSLPKKQLRSLVAHERAKLTAVAEAIARHCARASAAGAEGFAEHQAELRRLHASVFAPITWGLYIPSKRKSGGALFEEPYISAFLLSDASARDLESLGARVRNQACDVFTAFVPLSAIERLERSVAVRSIELSKLLSYDLGDTMVLTAMNTLHDATPPIDGEGVIVGVIDNTLDFYHPDFREADGTSRISYLWDQSLSPQGAEAPPPTLPGFSPTSGTYGVEYSRADIQRDYAAQAASQTAYQVVRHFIPVNAPINNAIVSHGTVVTGCAAGNGRADPAGTPPHARHIGAAPKAEIIFVSAPALAGRDPQGSSLPLGLLFADHAGVMDAFAYIFARASNRPCVVNLSATSNLGAHDGSSAGEQFLDSLLAKPGRAVTLASGDATDTQFHAQGVVAPGGSVTLTLSYTAGATSSDAVEIWYGGQDRFEVTLTAPDGSVIGPVAPGSRASVDVAGVRVQVSSVAPDPSNGDNCIRILLALTSASEIPSGDWTIALAGTGVLSGAFQAWVERFNRGRSAWKTPFVDDTQLTLGVPATAKRAITVGAHDKGSPTPVIAAFSGRGPTRDGRVKPEIATVGASLNAPASRNMNVPVATGQFYPYAGGAGGTSFSAPIVAGACALLFQCRGATATCADLKQVLVHNAVTRGMPTPNNTFGFGILAMKDACNPQVATVDVWIRTDLADQGLEPFTGPVFWESPDIAVLDKNGIPVANPTYSATERFNNIIRVTVRNRGNSTALNTDVYLHWADPATNLPFPSAWNGTRFFTGPGFSRPGNRITVPSLAPNAETTVDFGWAPPEPGNSAHRDGHFCLLVRLEDDEDLSAVGAGGVSVVTNDNNIAMRNVWVHP
ncbi:Ser-type protease [Minicystis rosea]|nr:Ser-type protease [Minicystis rosea]